MNILRRLSSRFDGVCNGKRGCRSGSALLGRIDEFLDFFFAGMLEDVVVK
jgi:hypothetical protein